MQMDKITTDLDIHCIWLYTYDKPGITWGWNGLSRGSRRKFQFARALRAFILTRRMGNGRKGLPKFSCDSHSKFEGLYAPVDWTWGWCRSLDIRPFIVLARGSEANVKRWEVKVCDYSSKVLEVCQRMYSYQNFIYRQTAGKVVENNLVDSTCKVRSSGTS